MACANTNGATVFGAGGPPAPGPAGTCGPAAGQIPAVAVAFTVAPVVTISSSTILFTFTPGAGVQAFSIAGVRANVAKANLGAGAQLQGAVARGGGAFIGKSDNVLVGFVNTVLASNNAPGTTPGASGFNLNIGGGALNFPACAPTVATPLGTPLTVLGNPDTSTGQVNSLKVTLSEGYTLAFTTLAGSDGVNVLGAPVLGLQGVRFRIHLEKVPNGVSIYTPEIMSAASTAIVGGFPATGSVTASVGTATAVLVLVTGNNADGSGGAFTGAVPNQYDLQTATGTGTFDIVYEVTTNSQTPLVPAAGGAVLGATDTFLINVVLTGTGSVATGAITGQLSPGPVGPPASAASIPQFAAGKSGPVVNVSLCASYLLFPWLVNTNDGNYDSGIAIANTTADPSVIGTVGQTGDVTAYFYPSDGSASFSQSIATGLKPGATATFVLSSLKKSFAG